MDNFSPQKAFESEKRFMHERFLRFLRVGVRSRMLQPEMQLVPTVTSLKVDRFNIFVENTVTVFLLFSQQVDTGFS